MLSKHTQKSLRWWVILFTFLNLAQCAKTSPTEPSTSKATSIDGHWAGVTTLTGAHGYGDPYKLPQDGTYCWDQYLRNFPQSSSFTLDLKTTTYDNPSILLPQTRIDGALQFSDLGVNHPVVLTGQNTIICKSNLDPNGSSISFYGGRFSATFWCSSPPPKPRISYWAFTCIRNSVIFPRWIITQQPAPNRDTRMAEEVYAYYIQIEGQIGSENQIQATWSAKFNRFCGVADEDWNSQCDDSSIWGDRYIGDLTTEGKAVFTKTGPSAVTPARLGSAPAVAAPESGTAESRQRRAREGGDRPPSSTESRQGGTNNSRLHQ